MKTEIIKIYSRHKTYYFWVLPEFLDVCPNPKKYSTVQLICDFYIEKYLHNPTEIATNLSMFGFDEGYYLNGRRVTQKEHFNFAFNCKLENIIGD